MPMGIVASGSLNGEIEYGANEMTNFKTGVVTQKPYAKFTLVVDRTYLKVSKRKIKQIIT